jgi:hypothetical protein
MLLIYRSMAKVARAIKKGSSNKTLLPQAAIHAGQNAIFDPSHILSMKRSFAICPSRELIVRRPSAIVCSLCEDRLRKLGHYSPVAKRQLHRAGRNRATLRAGEANRPAASTPLANNSFQTVTEKGWKILLFERLALFL